MMGSKKHRNDKNVSASQGKISMKGRNADIASHNLTPYFKLLGWAILLFFIAWLIWGKGFYSLTRNTGFALKDVQLFNTAETRRNHIIEIAEIEIGQSIFEVDLRNVQKKINALPWVSKSHIVRILPGELHIYVTEHRPVAIWQNQGEHRLIAHDGSVIANLKDVKPYRNLPIIAGDNAPNSFHLLTTLLESYPELKREFVAAKISRAFRWSLYLRNGTLIHLPGTNIDEAFVRLVWLDNQFQVLSLKASVIDLRTPDRATIGNNPYALTPISETG